MCFRRIYFKNTEKNVKEWIYKITGFLYYVKHTCQYFCLFVCKSAYVSQVLIKKSIFMFVCLFVWLVFFCLFVFSFLHDLGNCFFVCLFVLAPTRKKAMQYKWCQNAKQTHCQNQTRFISCLSQKFYCNVSYFYV